MQPRLRATAEPPPCNPKPAGRGFTLVEVIVVAVIVAILAAVGIPMFGGFIADARQNSVTTLAETAAAAANAFYRRTGEDPETAQLRLHYDETRYDVTVNANTVKVRLLIGRSVEKEISYKD